MTDYSTRYPTPPDGHPAPEDLSALLDSELDATPAAEIEAHLVLCESCRADYEQLAEVRGVLHGLVTSAPTGAAPAAVAAALVAVDGSAAHSAAGAEIGSRVLTLRRRQRRIRAGGIAAAVLLAAGVASGIGLVLSHAGGASSSAASMGQAGRAAASAASTTTAPSPGLLQLRSSIADHGPPRVLVSLGRNDVAAIRIRPAGGTFTATITLAAGHLLGARAVDAVRMGDATAVLSENLSGARGRGQPVGEPLAFGGKAGTVHAVSRRVLEITGLTRNGSLELKRLLG